MVKQPCTRECPDRKAGCHAKCEKWLEYEKARNAEYEKARNAEYERTAKEKQIAYTLYEIERDRKADIATGRMRQRRCKRNG